MRKFSFAKLKQRLGMSLIAVLFSATQILFPLLASSTVYAAGATINSSNHQGKNTDGTWTSGNTTLYKEGDYAHFRFTLTASQAAQGSMLVVFSNAANGCAQFFTNYFSIDSVTPAGTATVTPAGAPVSVAGGGGSSDWQQQLNLNFSAGGNVTVEYVLQFSFTAGDCNGSSTHSALAAAQNAGDYKNTGAQTIPLPGSGILYAPSITINKTVSGGSAVPSDFSFTVSPAIGGQTVFHIPSGQTSVTIPNINPDGVFTITESGPAGYTMISGSGTNCVVTSLADGKMTATVTAGRPAVDAICNFGNQQQTGSIKVIKDVVNDNGGNKTYADFTFTLNGTTYNFDATTSPDGAKTVTLPVGGPYSVVEPEANTMGYATSYNNCSNLTVVAGQTQTCTITNDDVAPSLTLNKIVNNTFGGNNTESDWTLTANGGNAGLLSGQGANGSTDVVSTAGFKAGTYALSENGPSGYSASSWTCTGTGTQNGSNITLAAGQSAVCTITNTAQQPTLTIVKNVTNAFGGTLAANDFGLKINNTSLSFIAGAPGTTTAYTATPSVNANTAYSLSEMDVAGYAEGSWSCSDGTNGVFGGISVTLDEGENVTCTISNSDIAPIINIIKVALNPYGTALLPDAFSLTLDGQPVFSGVNNPVTAGLHIVGETQQPGYQFTSFAGQNCTVDQQGAWTALGIIGQTTTCTITNTAIQPKLIIKKHVVNDNGGGKSSDDFNMTVSGNAVSDTNFPGDEAGTTVYLSEGAYTVDETTDGAYAKTRSADCSGTISIGQTKTCTITNDDKPGTLIVNKVVENGNNGDSEADDFSFKIDGDNTDYSFVNGQTTDVGSKAVQLNAGTYTATENDSFGYDKDDSDCKNVQVKNGEEASCTITNTAQRKVEICHRNNGIKHYVSISVPVSAIDGISGNEAGKGDHFSEHKGPVWIDGIDVEWGDIIPPLAGIHDGLNWDAYGQATYENDCTPPSQVIVTKYNDLNRNDQYDQGEELLPDWEFNLKGQELCENPELQVLLFQAINLDKKNCTDYSYDATQSTGADGTTTFTGIRPGVTHELTETIPADSNWHLGNITCDDEGSQDGSTYFLSGVESGTTVHCFVGNYRDVALNLTKSNDRPNPTTVGDTVTYTLTVTVPEDSGQVFGATVTDLTPEGFTYIPGSWNATLDGEPMLVEEPQYGSPGIWVLGNLLPGQVVKLTYKALIGTSVSNGTYPDLAFARGCNISCSNINASAVFANVSTGANTPFVGTNVTIARTVVPPANITNYVKTGASNVWMNALTAITLAGAALVTIVRREQKGAK